MSVFNNTEININFFPCSGKEFVGLIFKKNEIDVYHPKYYFLGNENREDIYNFLKAIVLTKRSTRKYSIYNQRTGFFDFPLESYDWIWKHYKKYGRYFENVFKYRKNGFGKIDWKKTIRQIPDYINDNFQYLNTINKSFAGSETIMTDIYTFCVCESYEKVQWMFQKTCPEILYSKKNISKRLLKEYKEIVLTRLSNTFNDDLKTLLLHMLNIIDGCNGGSLNQQVFGIESFDMVFEKMIYTVFHNVGDISKYYPKAFYTKINSENNPSPASSMREDTIFIDENQRLYIIDSKYYCDSFPQTESISKQIVYGEYIEMNHKKLSKLVPFKKEQIINIFLRPKEHDNNSLIISTDFIYAYSDWKANNTKKYEKILCLDIDLKFLIDNWNKNTNSIFKMQLVEAVDSFLKELN